MRRPVSWSSAGSGWMASGPPANGSGAGGSSSSWMGLVKGNGTAGSLSSGVSAAARASAPTCRVRRTSRRARGAARGSHGRGCEGPRGGRRDRRSNRRRRSRSSANRGRVHRRAARGVRSSWKGQETLRSRLSAGPNEDGDVDRGGMASSGSPRGSRGSTGRRRRRLRGTLGQLGQRGEDVVEFDHGAVVKPPQLDRPGGRVLVVQRAEGAQDAGSVNGAPIALQRMARRRLAHSSWSAPTGRARGQ